jgi:hypothetical protein
VLLIFIFIADELLGTVDKVTVLGDSVSDGCFQVASEDFVEKVIHGGCQG